MAAAPNSGLPPHSDNVDEELSRIRMALDTVYAPSIPAPSSPATDPNNTHFQQRQAANQYLTSFQTTAISWMVCDRLLWEGTGPNDNPNELMKLQQRQFFAAQTLHTKCRSDHDVQQLLQQQPPQPGETTPQVLTSLRDSLLQHLNRSVQQSTANSNAALTTRLALAISALAVQMGWRTVITDLLSTAAAAAASADSADNQAETVLRLLFALPEECASDRLHLIDDEQRFLMRDHFIESSAHVFQFFLHHLQQQQQQHDMHTLRVLQAWHAWIRYVPIRPHVIAESPLLPATVQALIASETVSPEVMEQAADVICEVLRMYPSHGPPENHVLVQQMMTLLSNLPLQQVLVAANGSGGDGDGDDEVPNVVRDYCRIVTEMGESYLSWILMAASSSSPEEQEAAFHLVDWVLMCSTHISDPDVAGITLHFWYRMVMDLEETEPMQWRQELIDLYSSRLLQFVSVCALNLMKYPADIDDKSEDQMDEIHRHRFYVSETVEDCCRLLGGHVVLQRIAELLQQQLSKATTTPKQNPNDWQGLESCLSCLVAIHKFVPEDENQVLPFVLEKLIPELLTQQSNPVAFPPPLRFTVSKVIGKFARWLAVHAASSPQLMPPLLPFLSSGLSIKDCAPAAALAIKELCVESHPHSFAIGQPVLELYEQVSAKAVAQHHQDAVSLRDELQLLEGVCIALSKHIQMDPKNGDGTAFLQRLVKPVGDRLASNVNAPSASPRTILPDLERLIVIVEHLKVYVDPSTGAQHPLISLMQSLWPLLESLISRFPNDVNTAEQIARLHKYTIRSCGALAYYPMLDPLMRHLVESYNRSHQSPFLYGASICVSEYGSLSSDPNPTATKQNLYGMVEALCNTTFSFLKSVSDFNDHPDVVEELFYLVERMIKHCPDHLVSSPMLGSLVEAAILSMNLHHHGAHKGTYVFLEALVSYALMQQPLQQQQKSMVVLEQVLNQHGSALVSNLTHALMGDLPSHSPKIPEIFWKLKRLTQTQTFTQWLSTSLTGGAATAIPAYAKNELMAAAASTDVSREDFILAIRSFQNASKRQRRQR